MFITVIGIHLHITVISGDCKMACPPVPVFYYRFILCTVIEQRNDVDADDDNVREKN